MEYKFRSDCPITSALDILGDKWMLVIVKQMLIDNKHTFKEFIESDEAIATNILSSKLKILEDLELVSKSKLPNNKKTNIYHLTEKGLELTPLIIELALWSDKNLRGLNTVMQDGDALAMMRKDKVGLIEIVKDSYRAKLATTPKNKP